MATTKWHVLELSCGCVATTANLDTYYPLKFDRRCPELKRIEAQSVPLPMKQKQARNHALQYVMAAGAEE